MKLTTLFLFITCLAFGQKKSPANNVTAKGEDVDTPILVRDESGTSTMISFDTVHYPINAVRLDRLNKLQEKLTLLKQETERTEAEINGSVEMMLGVQLSTITLFYDPKKQEFKYVKKPIK